MFQEGSPDRVSRPSGHPAALGCLVGAAWPSLGGSWAAFGVLVGPLGPVLFFFTASWAPLGAVLPLSWTSWAPLPTVLGRSWRLLGHVGDVKSRWQDEMKHVRFTIVKRMILRIRGPSGNAAGRSLELSLAVRGRLSKRKRILATLTRSFRPPGPLLGTLFAP